MRSLHLAVAGAALLLASACSETTPVALFEPQALALPALVPALGPRIAVGQDSTMILSWMEPGENGTALKYARYLNGGWSQAEDVVVIPDMFVNWADMPSVTPLENGRLAAHWLQKSADLTYAYDVVYMQSADDGTSWSEAIRPHTDGTPTEHGFVSTFADGPRTGLIWLDGRKMVNAGTDDPAASGMTLRAAFMDESLQRRGEQVVDELICDCCQTDVAVAASGPVAVYRDRSIDEIRDIYVTRYVDGQWRPGRAVAHDQWHIAGCPVNGPSIGAAGESVAIAWFTGAGGRPVVKMSWSNDSAENFGAPIEVIDGSVLGRVRLVLLTQHVAVVSWLQAGDDGAGEVHVRRIGSDGNLGPIHVVSRHARSFSVPQLARSGNDLIFVWTDSETDQSRILSARVPISAL